MATKFNLNDKIDNWSKAYQKTLSHEDIEELKSHLFDEIDTLKATGLTEEESFLIASHRLGDKKTITNEYAKVNKLAVFYQKLLPTLKVILGFCVFISLMELIIVEYNMLYYYQKYTYSSPLIIGLLILNTFVMIYFFLLPFFYGYKKYHQKKSIYDKVLDNIPLMTVILTCSVILKEIVKVIGVREVIAYRLYHKIFIGTTIHKGFYLTILLLIALGITLYYKRSKKTQMA